MKLSTKRAMHVGQGYLLPLAALAGVVLVLVAALAVSNTAIIPGPLARANTTVAGVPAKAVEAAATSQSRLTISDGPPVSSPTPGGKVREGGESTETDLATLQREVDFAIWQPQKLPAGVELLSVRRYTQPPTAGQGAHLVVTLRYETPMGPVTLSQYEPRYSLEVDISKQNVIEKFEILGHQAVLYRMASVFEGTAGTVTPGEELRQGFGKDVGLAWTDGKRWVLMFGNQDNADLMVQLAQSLGPSS